MNDTILNVCNISKNFKVNTGLFSNTDDIFAVKNVSFHVLKGEMCALVGQSGCGKSTLAKMMVKLIPPSSGDIYFEGMNISKMKSGEFRKLRPAIQMVFQNPFDCFNPCIKMRQLLTEGMLLHKIYTSNKEIKNKLDELLDDCRLSHVNLDKYPQEFSGGELQRFAIIRALSLNPRLIIADEILSALDVPIQQQVADIFMKLRHKYRLTTLFISHDLAVVKDMADYIIVMKKGEIVEKGIKKAIFENPSADYTKELLGSVIPFEVRD